MRTRVFATVAIYLALVLLISLIICLAIACTCFCVMAEAIAFPGGGRRVVGACADRFAGFQVGIVGAGERPGVTDQRTGDIAIKQAASRCANPCGSVHISLHSRGSITDKIYWFAATIFLVGHLPPPGSKVAATDARPFGSTIKNRADCTPLLAVNPLFTSCCNGAAART